jgi:hypothetical protein
VEEPVEMPSAAVASAHASAIGICEVKATLRVWRRGDAAGIVAGNQANENVRINRAHSAFGRLSTHRDSRFRLPPAKQYLMNISGCEATRPTHNDLPALFFPLQNRARADTKFSAYIHRSGNLSLRRDL